MYNTFLLEPFLWLLERETGLEIQTILYKFGPGHDLKYITYSHAHLDSHLLTMYYKITYMDCFYITEIRRVHNSGTDNW